MTVLPLGDVGTGSWVDNCRTESGEPLDECVHARITLGNVEPGLSTEADAVFPDDISDRI
jgi:hypothetical protein